MPCFPVLDGRRRVFDDIRGVFGAKAIAREDRFLRRVETPRVGKGFLGQPPGIRALSYRARVLRSSVVDCG